MSLEKIAQYRDEIEKVASRAWKRNLGKIGEKGVEKLVDSGVLNRPKELKGMRRGTAAILGKNNAKMYRKSEHAAGLYTRNAVNNAKKRGYSFDKEDIAATKESLKGMGPFGAPDASVKGVKRTGAAHVKKNVDKQVRGLINPAIKEVKGTPEGKGLKELKGIPRKDREAKKWNQAIFERHEADEVRMGKKIMKSKKKTMDIGNGPQPATQFASHLTPKVVMAESANVALAPKATKDKFKHLRNWNASVSGKQNTEMGALREMSGNKFQYGKSGAYDKKTANKIEKNVIKQTKAYV